jgi:hypothetical protein
MKASNLVVLWIILVFASVGCNRITESNYNKIENGMTMAEVDKLLGKGIDVMNEPGKYVYMSSGGGTRNGIIVWYKEGKVTDKKFTQFEHKE